MDISLRPIVRENYEAVCDLELSDDQQSHLDSNVESVLESKFDEVLETRAICPDDDPVGFLLWHPDVDGAAMIWRFMVDGRHQNRGIGRAALALAIEEMKREDGDRAVQITYHPDNEIARALYLSVGFREVGMSDDGTEMLATLMT